MYRESADDKDNITHFEFITWILSQCATVREAKNLVERINILNTPFNDELPFGSAALDYFGQDASVTVESVEARNQDIYIP